MSSSTPGNSFRDCEEYRTPAYDATFPRVEPDKAEPRHHGSIMRFRLTERDMFHVL